MSLARWKGTACVKVQMHSLKPRCSMGIYVFVKYVFYSTYLQNHKPVVSNAARSHGIACEGRIRRCSEVRVASEVLPAAALPQHWSGFLEVGVAGCFGVFCPDETLSSSGDQAGRPSGAFQLLLQSPGSPPLGDLTRYVRHRPHFETHGCPSRCILGKTRYKYACSTIRTEGKMSNLF